MRAWLPERLGDPRFWRARRAFDPGAVLRSSRGRGAAEADMLAMRSDWEAVGEDLWRALDTLATPREAGQPVADAIRSG